MRPGCPYPAQVGSTLLELCLAMAIAGVLTLAGTWTMEDGGIELSAAHQEIHGSLEQAFTLARARPGAPMSPWPWARPAGPGSTSRSSWVTASSGANRRPSPCRRT